VTVAEPGTIPAPRAVGSAGGSGGEPLHILAVGSIVPRKGYLVLIDALAGLLANDADNGTGKNAAGNDADHWRLTIAGGVLDPAEFARVSDAAGSCGLQQRLELVGAVTDDALGALYASADLFVMPSLFEGYGMVLAEAMARGLPIVCTTGGAAAETVPDGAALKVPPGDHGALRKALRRAITEPELRQQLSQASWAAGQSLPRWDDTCRIIASVLRASVLKGTT
jgi:glycosyltransferase involved in cell wall biosynthesis